MDLEGDLRLIHQPARLRIMGLLYKRRDVAFTQVRDTLGLTDGNVASHATRLEDAGLLVARNALTSDGFQKRYRITEDGSRAFRRYLGELKGFLEGVDSSAARDEGTEAGADPGDSGEITSGGPAKPSG